MTPKGQDRPWETSAALPQGAYGPLTTGLSAGRVWRYGEQEERGEEGKGPLESEGIAFGTATHQTSGVKNLPTKLTNKPSFTL
eukprot:1064980-Pelagomonas_calceolata.AAC.3